MKKGAPGVVSLLEKSPPRLILPMEKACIDVLREALVQRGYDLGTNDEFPLAVPIAILTIPKDFTISFPDFESTALVP